MPKDRQVESKPTGGEEEDQEAEEDFPADVQKRARRTTYAKNKNYGISHDDFEKVRLLGQGSVGKVYLVK